MKKIKKSTWLPALILIYFIGMTVAFAPELVKTGQWMRLISVFLIEIILICLLRIFLLKKEKRQEGN